MPTTDRVCLHCDGPIEPVVWLGTADWRHTPDANGLARFSCPDGTPHDRLGRPVATPKPLPVKGVPPHTSWKTVNMGEAIALRKPDGSVVTGYIGALYDFVADPQTDHNFTD